MSHHSLARLSSDFCSFVLSSRTTKFTELKPWSWRKTHPSLRQTAFAWTPAFFSSSSSTVFLPVSTFSSTTFICSDTDMLLLTLCSAGANLISTGIFGKHDYFFFYSCCFCGCSKTHRENTFKLYFTANQSTLQAAVCERICFRRNQICDFLWIKSQTHLRLLHSSSLAGWRERLILPQELTLCPPPPSDGLVLIPPFLPDVVSGGLSSSLKLLLTPRLWWNLRSHLARLEGEKLSFSAPANLN